MKKIKIYQVDAFANKVFEGNPAAVCPLDTWLDDEVLQKIAEENNLSETAFFVVSDNVIELRWFTPVEEVNLCGHATLATAHVLRKHLNYQAEEMIFSTKSGNLSVTYDQNGYHMDFPASMPTETIPPEHIIKGLGHITPTKILAAFDYIIVLNSEEELLNLTPDFRYWEENDLRGVIVTAPGNDTDFVSRCFFPNLNVNEDPVTGSAHCELMPYWAAQFKRNELTGLQLSSRRGLIRCQLREDRVVLTGNAVDYMAGEIYLATS